MNSNTCSIISRKCVVSKRNLTTWRFLCQTDNIIQRPYWFTVKIPKCCSVCQKGKSPLFAKLPSFSNMQAVSIFGQAISGRRGLAVPIPRYNLWKTDLSPPLPENNSSSRPLSATTALASTSLTNQRPSNDLVCNRIRLPSNPCEIQVNLPCTVEKVIRFKQWEIVFTLTKQLFREIVSHANESIRLSGLISSEVRINGPGMESNWFGDHLSCVSLVFICVLLTESQR